MYEFTNITNGKVIRKDLIYPELSYIIIGILFDVYNSIGPGHREKHYQKAVEIALKTIGLPFEKEVFSPLVYKDKKIGNYFLDFLIDGQIILELKSNSQFLRKDISQLFSYLKAKNMKLGILVNFGKEKLNFKRILNLY